MLVLFSRVRDVLDGSSALIKLRSYKTDRTYGDLLLKPREGTKRILRIFVEKYRSDIPQRRNSKYLFCTQSGDALSQDCLKLNPSYNWYRKWMSNFIILKCPNLLPSVARWQGVSSATLRAHYMHPRVHENIAVTTTIPLSFDEYHQKFCELFRDQLDEESFWKPSEREVLDPFKED
ncbi:hypothetical protein GNI_196770 [Gregarina niphandrodes]|uniref:Uncharacterized protein n=1 Tax=Gregarina niphandrodes TaxID=110365 RepID=A0A023AWR0_GRENI|nr:hypothetical protein GNI_196770 [Gregarina niphandrodes]EZG43012.1 hypothetical protein GNI_196770 [Gregarina niphandrodes]|eukprot:XP_011133715.1 hypothetical protein GNI_196770 [Gregarina niphandrodes]